MTLIHTMMIVGFAETEEVRDAVQDKRDRQRQKDAADAVERERERQVEVGVHRMMMFIATALPALLAIAWVFEEPKTV